MSNSISKAHTLPSSSLEQDSLINPGESYDQQAQFPVHNRLIVTTTRGVYTWGAAGIFEMFHSGSSGIVAAKKLGPDQGRLAIADSQVVVLHDVHKGMQRSYRLKGSEVIISTHGVVNNLPCTGSSQTTKIRRQFYRKSVFHYFSTELSTSILPERFKATLSSRYTPLPSIRLRSLLRFATLTFNLSPSSNNPSSSYQHACATFIASTPMLFLSCCCCSFPP